MFSVSAIVSAYYAEEYLRGRLDNLLSQTLVPEIVVVCLQDSVEHKIVMEYKVEGMCIIPTPSIPTVYAAWNTGIRCARGRFLTNANSDDRLHPAAIERLSSELEAHPTYGVVYADVAVTEKLDGPVVRVFQWAEGGLKALLEGCFLGPMPMWRRELHDKYGMFDESLHSAGDYEFWLRLAARGEKFWHIKEVLGTYLDHKDSIEHREPLRSVWESARARAKYR